MNQRTFLLLQKAKDISISQVLDHFNVNYDKSLSYLISCPIPTHIHISNTPSFKVYKDTNSFYCFGCKAAGGPAQLVQHMLKKSSSQVVSLEEALSYMEENFGISVFSSSDAFLKITKSIKSNNSITSDLSFSKVCFERLISLSEKIRNFHFSYLTESRLINKLSETYGELYYQQRMLLNKFQTREAFECNTNSILESFSNYIDKCQQMGCVIDAISLLEPGTM